MATLRALYHVGSDPLKVVYSSQVSHYPPNTYLVFLDQPTSVQGTITLLMDDLVAYFNERLDDTDLPVGVVPGNVPAGSLVVFRPRDLQRIGAIP